MKIPENKDYSAFKYKKIRDICLVFMCVSAFAGEISAENKLHPDYQRNWGDLNEHESRKFYGSERDEKYPVRNPLFQKEKWEDHFSFNVSLFYKYTNYPRFKSHRFLFPPAPLFYSLKSKVDNRKKTWLFPVWYYKRYGDHAKTITPLGFFGRDNSGWDASLLYLFYAGAGITRSKGEEYFSRKRHGGIFPLFYFRSRKTVNGLNETRDFKFRSILGFRESSEETDRGRRVRKNSRTVSPFYVSSFSHNLDCGEGCESRYSKKMIPMIPFLYYGLQNDKYKTANLLTLFHWRKTDGKLSRLWIFPFLFAGRMENEKYFHLLPFFLSYRKSDFRAAAFFPFFMRWKSGVNRKGLYTPIFQYHRDGDLKHFAFLYPIFHYKKDAGKIQKLWVPLSYYKKNSYYHLFPVWFSWKDPEKNIKTKAAPGYFSRDTANKKMRLYGLVWKSEDAEKESSVFQILPVYYQKKDPSGTVSKFFYVFDYSSDAEGKLSRLWFFPVFYKKNKYFHLFPVFFRPNAKDSERGVSFGPGYYHRWSNEEDNKWALLYYGRYRKDNDRFVSYLFPFYYSWKTDYSTGKVVAPLYLEYEDKNKYIKLVFAYWNKKSAGYISPDVGIGRAKGRWYLDGDASVFYNLFSLHSRVSMPVPDRFKGEIAESPDVKNVEGMMQEAGSSSSEIYSLKDEKTGRPLISKKEGLKRENADFYFGWDALFGLVSYARSDTKRHFRMLPLGWFTWDTASENRVVLFPPVLPVYFHYNSDELEYKVIFPFYAKQRKGNSYIKSYLFIAYLSEYDEEEDLHEHSILWPIVNFYKSPVRKGSRVLPFYHYRSVLKDDVRSERLLTPVYLKKRDIVYEKNNPEKIQRENYLSVSPLHYSKQFYTDSGDVKRKIFFAPLVPVVYRESITRYDDNDHTRVIGEMTRMVTPVYVFYREKSDTKESASRSYPLLPLYSKKEVIFYENVPAGPETALKNKAGEPGPAAKNATPDKKASGKENSEKRIARRETSSYLFPFYYKSTIHDSSFEKDQTVLLVPLLPLYARWTTGEGISTWIAGFYTYRGYKGFKKNNFLYLAETESYKELRYLRRNYIFRSVSYKTSAANKEFNLLYGALVHYKKNNETNDYRLSILASLYGKSQTGAEKKFHIFPFVFSSRSPERTKLFAFGYYHKKHPGYVRKNILYLYDHEKTDSIHYERHSYALGTVSRRKYQDRKNLRFLWGLGANYTKFNEAGYSIHALSYLTGFRKSGERTSHYFFPIYSYRKSDSMSRLLFPMIPVFAYSVSKHLEYGDSVETEKHTRYLLGALWYRNDRITKDTINDKPQESGFRKRLFLLGVYYHLENLDKKTARKGVLWGLIYNYKKKPLRGFESRGSLWGLLWSYDTEKDTPYKKFSVLKFLYSSTTTAKGERFFRIFGFKIKRKPVRDASLFQKEDYLQSAAQIGMDASEFAGQKGVF